MSSIKHVYVVLSKSPTVLSLAIGKLKGDRYTHAALSLDKSLFYMFSFGRRRPRNPFVGCFKHEKLGEGMYENMNTLPGVVLEIPVTENQYESICGLTEGFLQNAHLYGYNYFGLAGNLFGLSQVRNKRFFCSEFVYHVLYESGVCDFGMPRGMVRPQTLLRLQGSVVFEGNLKLYESRPAAAAMPELPFGRYRKLKTEARV